MTRIDTPFARIMRTNQLFVNIGSTPRQFRQESQDAFIYTSVTIFAPGEKTSIFLGNIGLGEGNRIHPEPPASLCKTGRIYACFNE